MTDGHARATLASAEDPLRRKVVDLLDLRVQVLGWDICGACAGRGLLPTAHKVRQMGNTGIVCPDCLRTRHIPVLRITGQIPELLLNALSDGAEVTELRSPGVGAVLPFEADVRIA